MLTPEYRDIVKKILEDFGVKNLEELMANDAYNNGIEVECKVISTRILDDECHSLTKSDYTST